MSLSFCPQHADRTRLEDVFGAITPPRHLVSWDAAFGQDWSGDPSVRVFLRVHDRAGLEANGELAGLQRFAHRIQRDAAHRGLAHWPYIEIVNTP